MLEIRPFCEHCGKALPNTATDAMICSFECTYCSNCAIGLFENVCPSCSGNFEKRPIRPKNHLLKYPPSAERKVIPKDLKIVKKITNAFRNIAPKDR